MPKLKINDRSVEAIFFHKPEEPYGWLSNWTLDSFEVDGVTYASVEQYIMYQKCMLFGDGDAAKQVMNTNDPAKQQLIARNATGFIPKVWDGIRQTIVEKALYARFTQNENSKKMLLDTGDAWLIECANTDKNWACGVGLEKDDKSDASKWLGTNILGFALMKVRDDISSKKASAIPAGSNSAEQKIEHTETNKEQGNSKIHIVKKGITKFRCDAVVNAANSTLSYGAGVCGHIFDAAGVENMKNACNAIGRCKTGQAVITPGFDLPAKHVIHAVGPIWTDGEHNEKKLLYSAYKLSLLLAKKKDLHSIAFPLISAGIYEFPKDLAWRKALQACNDFIKDNPDYEIDISFAVIDDDILKLGQAVRKDLGI